MQYHQVSSSEATSNGSPSNTTARQPLSERFFDKVIAAVWVLIAVLVARSTKFWSTVLSSSSKANHALLQVFYLILGINTVLLLYLTIYLPRVKKLDSSAWDVYCPRVIPTMSFLGVVQFLVLIRAVWPVYGFLGPLIVGAEAMGILFSLHFVPSF